MATMRYKGGCGSRPATRAGIGIHAITATIAVNGGSSKANPTAKKQTLRLGKGVHASACSGGQLARNARMRLFQSDEMRSIAPRRVARRHTETGAAAWNVPWMRNPSRQLDRSEI